MTFGDDADLHGDVKTFVVGSLSYQPDLVGSGIGAGDFRLKLRLRGEDWRFEAHHALDLEAIAAPTIAAGGFGLSGATGVGLTAPQLVDLTWEPELGGALTVRGRVDRLLFALTPPHLAVTFGRQPISFGSGLVFTPLDLVNPFFPATIDTEYKPGVDAVRVDGYAGTAGRLSAVAAWAGPLPPYDAKAQPIALEDLVLAADGQDTVGVTDLQGFFGLVRHDVVFGASVVSALGPVGVHSDATLTLPGPQATEDGPFVRAVVGADGRPTSKTTISVEGYVQTMGQSRPRRYLAAFGNPRFQRGEVWLVGRYYGSLAVSQELTPLITGSVATIVNLEDPSALLLPSLSWSVADETAVGVGGYLAVGRRADPRVHSEFGLYPDSVYVSMRSYF